MARRARMRLVWTLLAALLSAGVIAGTGLAAVALTTQASGSGAASAGGTTVMGADADSTPIPSATPTGSTSPLSVNAGPNQTVLGTNIVDLDGQVTGTPTSTAWSEVSGPGTADFASPGSTKTTVTVSSPGTYTFELTASAGPGNSASGQVTVAVQAYVALGDSYSAGDGAVADASTATPSDYLPGGTSLIPSASGDAGCLQSVVAYPELVDTVFSAPNPVPAGTPNPAFTFDACTGALIGDMIADAQKAGNENVAPQISALEEEPAHSVGLVTLTIGGNDAGFGDVMTYCAGRFSFQESCEDHSEAEVNQAINGGGGMQPLEVRLTDLYTQIKDVTNIGGQSPLAPGARIVVLGYPKFFPTGQPSACLTGALASRLFQFQTSDMAWIDNVIYRVDNVIQAAAAASGFTYFDTYNAFDGNELCQASPYLNDATADGHLKSALGVNRYVQSFHPTIDGQVALAAFALGKGVSEAPAIPSFTSTPQLSVHLRTDRPASFTFTAAGNPPPTFTISSGTIPMGLTLDPVSGLISGTPTKKGSYTFRVTASNSAGSVTSGTFDFVVS